MSLKPTYPHPGLSITKKFNGNRTNYTPLELSDASVYDMAAHWYTLEEIAERFNVTAQGLLEKHGEAYREGKANGKNLPRMLLRKIISDFADDEVNFARSDVPTHNLLKAIELHARKHEGMGSTQTIITKEDKPSVGDIKFVPLSQSNT